MQRFFLPASAKKGKEVIIDSPDLVRQLSFVLRLKPEDQIICLFNDEEEHTVSLSHFSKKEVSGMIIETRKNENELPFELYLFQALPKSKDKWEFIVQKAVELGVSHIVPLHSSRSSAKYPSYSERIQKILTEAGEQSERGILPVIEKEMDIHQLHLPSGGVFFVADSYDKHAPILADAVFEKKKTFTKNGKVGVIIGSEGGFSEVEVQDFKKQGAQSVSLGKRILRLETASVVALGIVATSADT